MLIAEVVSDRDGDVFTIPPSASLETASKLLGKNRIGVLVVCDRWGKLVGILSERDVVRALSERGLPVMSESVESAMTRKVETCSPLDEVEDVVGRMNRHGFRHMPVVEVGEVVTVVSIRDLSKVLVENRARDCGTSQAWNPLRWRMPVMIAR